MNMRELFILFGLETKKEDFEKLEKNIEGIKDAAHRFLEVYVGEKIIHGLIDGFKEFGETSREIMDSQLLGLTTTQYQVLQQSAQMYGVQRQRFNMGMALMQRNAFEAIRGNKEAALTFAQLGVTVTDSNGKLKNAQTLLYNIADGMQKFKNDPASRVALGEKLFGMRDLEFQNLLLKGSAGIRGLEKDAASLGFVMDRGTVEAGERFNQVMMRMRFISDGLKNKLMGALAPVINDLADKVTNWVRANQKLIDQKVKEFASGLVDVCVALFQITLKLLEVFKLLADHVGGVAEAVKILIYTFFGLKILDFVAGVWNLYKGFTALAAAIRLSAVAMGIFETVSGLVVVLGVVTAIYYALKYIYDLIWGDKAGAIDINQMNKDNAGIKQGYLPGQENRFIDYSNTSKSPSLVMNPSYEINIGGSGDPRATAASLKEVLTEHTDSMIKDAHRKLGYMLEY